ncbi:MAG: S24 family peptidase [Bacteroidota bacterium]
MADFSQNMVNRRFFKVYEALEKYGLIKGKSDIAKRLGTYNHVINSILKGQRNITVDQLTLLFEYFSVNANYVFGISDDMFLKAPDGAAEIPTHFLSAQAFGPRANITLVPDRALAGYALEHQSNDFFEGLQKFSLPNLEGSLVAFEISGDSMTPTITNGDIVVCEPMESDTPLRDNQVYVIVTDVVVAKRIQQIREDNQVTKLQLISDNDTVYKPYDVELEEIRQILKVKCRLTSYAIV